MASTLLLTITNAGLDALVDAQNGETEAIRITELGLSDQPVAVAPTLEALPGEFKRIDTLSGESASETVIHMTATDTSEDVYDVRSLGLFLEDGTLFAAYSAGENLIFRKVDIAAFLFSVDVAFAEAVAEAIEFGEATFLFPPATETKKGVAEIATLEETEQGEDDQRIVTPAKLKVLLDAIRDTASGLTTAIGTLLNRTITGGGLATGGGSLAANRVITVTAASATEADAGELTTKALTPASLVNILASIASKAASAITITGGGLVTGGGSLTMNRTLTVTPASGAEIAAGTENSKAVTPAAMAEVPQTSGQHLGLGGAMTKHGVASTSTPGATGVTFPLAFPTACDAVLITPHGNPEDTDEDDEPWWVSNITASGFTINVGGDGNNINFGWVAFGR